MNQSDRNAQIQIIDRLTAEPPSIDAKYLYDPLGCRLFEAITHLDTYYPPAIEQALLERHLDQITTDSKPATLVDLGAGNCQKARTLFARLAPTHYVAVDFSEKFLTQTLTALRSEFPAINIQGVAADLGAHWSLPLDPDVGPQLFFYPGSSIGNFAAIEADRLLRRIQEHCRKGDGLLIGIDLLKERSVLEAAYDDPTGVTAAFNRNILSHINRLIGSDFQPRRWKHHALFNEEMQRIEMHLEAGETQTVNWPGGRRRFSAGERIHTENSYKYCLPDFEDRLREAGFRTVRSWTDSRQWFALSYARV